MRRVSALVLAGLLAVALIGPVLGADASKDVVVLEGDAVVLTDDSAPEPRVMAQIA